MVDNQRSTICNENGMGQTKGKYTREFKEDVLRMFSSGQETGTDLERDLGLGSGMIYKWRKHLQ